MSYYLFIISPTYPDKYDILVYDEETYETHSELYEERFKGAYNLILSLEWEGSYRLFLDVINHRLAFTNKQDFIRGSITEINDILNRLYKPTKKMMKYGLRYGVYLVTEKEYLSYYQKRLENLEREKIFVFAEEEEEDEDEEDEEEEESSSVYEYSEEESTSSD